MNDPNRNPIDSWETDSYETGSTQPPKSRGGLVAVLLVAVILLCGISTVLGFWNVRLSLQLHNSHINENLSFSKTEPTDTQSEDASEMPSATDKPTLGLTGRAVSALEQRFYHLPAGFLITEVDHGSAAAEAGIQVGDVLVSINGQMVTDQESIDTVLDSMNAGDAVQLAIFCNNQEHTVLLRLDEIG